MRQVDTIDRLWEFPFVPIPDVPNANGVVYPRDVLMKALVDANSVTEIPIINAMRIGLIELGLIDQLDKLSVFGRVESIELGTGGYGKIIIRPIPSVHDMLVRGLLRTGSIGFGIVTKATVQGFFDRREYPSGTKLVVDEISEIVGVHPLYLDTKQSITFSEDTIVQEARIP